MSLINEMLKDLEARDRAAGPGAPSQVVLDDLRPVRQTRTASSLPRLLMILLPLAAGVGFGAYYFLKPGGPTGPIAATSAKTEVPARQSAVQLERRDPPPIDAAKSDSVVAAPAVDVTPTVAVAPAVVVEEKKVAPAKPAPAPKPVASAPRPRVASAPVQKPEPIAESSGKIVIEKNDRPVSPYEQADVHYRKAAQQMDQGRGEEARTELNAALSIHPAHHAARDLAAALAMQNGRWHEAEELLTQGIKLAPTRLSFAQLLARAYLEQGQEAQAIATLEGARQAAAGDAGYLSFLAALYQRAGRHADAIGVYRGAIEVRAQDARAWLGLGISLEATQDADAASQAYTRALQLGGLDAKLAQYAQLRLTAIKK